MDKGYGGEKRGKLETFALPGALGKVNASLKTKQRKGGL